MYFAASRRGSCWRRPTPSIGLLATAAAVLLLLAIFPRPPMGGADRSHHVLRFFLVASALQSLSTGSTRILAIGSGGSMAMLLGGRLGLSVPHIVDLNLQIRNTSLSQFFINREKFLLATWNAVPHLEIAGRESSITYG